MKKILLVLMLFTFLSSFSIPKSTDVDVRDKTVKLEQVFKSYDVLKAEGWTLLKLTFEKQKPNSPYAIARFEKNKCEMICYSNTISDFYTLHFYKEQDYKVTNYQIPKIKIINNTSGGLSLNCMS